MQNISHVSRINCNGFDNVWMCKYSYEKCFLIGSEYPIVFKLGKGTKKKLRAIFVFVLKVC